MSAKRKNQRTKASESRPRALGSNLEQLAKKSMPKWRIVPESDSETDEARYVDAVSPKLTPPRNSSSLKSENKQQMTMRRSADKEKKSKKLSGLVNMAPTSEEDARLGAKTQVFEDDEHTASQG
jgi:hypothetical protein